MKCCICLISQENWCSIIDVSQWIVVDNGSQALSCPFCREMFVSCNSSSNQIMVESNSVQVM
jgi:hypothetical protein